MKNLNHFFIVLFAFSAFGMSPGVLSAVDASPSPAQLRLSLVESIGQLPPNPGHQVAGRVVVAAAGENASYQARIVQTYRQIAGQTTVSRRAADFTHENQTRNMRFFLSGEDAWAASPEITVNAPAEQIPYMARFDFDALYNELLDILARGSRSPDFRMEQDHNEIYVHGQLQNGWNAIFTINAVE